MTLRGGTRSLAARLGRLEQHIPEAHGPIVYQVLFHDGTPVWPGPDAGAAVASKVDGIVYRIASWEDFGLTGVQPAARGMRSRAIGAAL